MRRQCWTYTLTIPLSQAKEIAKHWSTNRPTHPARSPTTAETSSLATKHSSQWTPASLQTGLAFLAVAYAVLLPATVRRLFMQACRNTDVHIDVVPVREDKPCDVYATTNAKRQRRRLTWSENVLRNAISPNTSVIIQMAVGDPAAERLFSVSRLAMRTATACPD